MRVDHRAFVHVGAYVNKHRWHADHGGRHIGAGAHRRSTRHDAHAIPDSKPASRERVFIHEGKTHIFAHLAEFAEAKAKQNALFHPDIHDPLPIDLFRGANLALGQFVAKVHEDLAGIGIALNFEGGETFDGRSEGFHPGKVYGIFSLRLPTADSHSRAEMENSESAVGNRQMHLHSLRISTPAIPCEVSRASVSVA